MPRINELVRIATLGRHFEQGLVSSVEIIDDGEHWSVRVHYNERAEGPKTRFLTSQRKPGPKQYACFYTVWRVLTEHGITTATINKVTPKNNRRIWVFLTKTATGQFSPKTHGFDVLRDRFQPDLTAFQFADNPHQVRQVATQSVQAPHHQHIAGAQRFQAVCQLGPLRILAAGVLLVDPRAPRSLKRVELQVDVLLGGGDADIAAFYAIFSYNYLQLISR